LSNIQLIITLQLQRYSKNFQLTSKINCFVASWTVVASWRCDIL